MSRESVKGFAARVRSDEQLRKRVRAIDTRDRAKALAAVTQVAREAGFQFTVDDAQSLIRGRVARAGAELDLDDLEKIAGGGEEGFMWQWGSE